MVKIILAVDDYNESLSCQTLLKKLGFDVMSIARDLQFHSTTLGFLPDIVIASLKTKNVDGLAVGLEAKKLISKPRVLLLYPGSTEPALPEDAKKSYDFLLSSPFDFEKLIKCVADMARMDYQTLLDKYVKTRMRRSGAQGSMTVFGGKDITNDAKYLQSTISSDERKKKYAQFLAKTKDEPMHVMDHKAMVAKLQDFEEKNKKDLGDSVSINAQKLEFAKALFKKE